MATAFALTSNGVERVQTFHNQLSELKVLATYLCQEEGYHDWHYDPKTTTKTEFDIFDRQVETRGYCDQCRNFAARLLAFQGIA